MKKPFLSLSIIVLILASYIPSALYGQNINDHFSVAKSYVILIVNVLPNSAAKKAGFAVNDIIYSFNGKVFYDNASPTLAKDFFDYIISLPPGMYTAEVIRQAKKVNIAVSLPGSSVSPRLGVNMYILENDPKEHFSQGVMKFMGSSTRDDFKEASGFFERAKILSPEWADVYYNLGLLYEKLDYYDKAASNLQSYLELSTKTGSPIDTEQIKKLIEDNEKKQERLNYIKSMMVKRKWKKIKTIPEQKTLSVCSFYMEGSESFVFDDSGNMWMANHYKMILDSSNLIRENIKRHPWFKVKFDGRYFEVRTLHTSIRMKADQNYFFNGFTMYKGELDISSSKPVIRVRQYTINFPGEYNDWDTADREGIKKLESVSFDDIKHFRCEGVWELQ